MAATLPLVPVLAIATRGHCRHTVAYYAQAVHVARVPLVRQPHACVAERGSLTAPHTTRSSRGRVRVYHGARREQQCSGLRSDVHASAAPPSPGVTQRLRRTHSYHLFIRATGRQPQSTTTGMIDPTPTARCILLSAAMADPRRPGTCCLPRTAGPLSAMTLATHWPHIAHVSLAHAHRFP